MADTSVAITAGTGTSIDTRTEATNGNHRQVIVVGDPATNAGVAPVDGTAGLKVDLGTDNDVTVTGTVDLGATDNAVLDAIAADTTTLAGAVAGTEVQADIVSSALPTGAATAANQSTLIGHVDGVETLLGTIDADTSALAGAVAGTEVQVDVVGSLPAGTNSIGKLGANSGVDIGDVDVTSLPSTIHSADFDSGAGTDTTLAMGIAVPASGGAVVIPGDATAGLKVNLGADNDITGTVTANLGATDNAVLDDIAAKLGTIDADTGAIATDAAAIETLLTTIEANQLADAHNVTVANPEAIGGGTQYTEAATDATITGTAIMWEDAADTLRAVSASKPLPISDAGGALTVDGTVTANLGATDNAVLDQIQTNTTNLNNAIVQDDSPFTPATGYLMMIGGEYDDAGTDSVDEGDAGNVRITANRSMHTTLRDAAGNERGANVDASNRLTVIADLGATDNAVLDDIAANQTDASQKTQIVDGAGNVIGSTSNALDVNIASGSSAGTEYNEDAAAPATIAGGAVMMERDDVLSAVTPIEGDWLSLRGTAEGAVWTQDFNSDSILADTTAIKNSLETAGGQLVNLGTNNDVTVTGTVDLGATDNAVLDSIDTDLTTIIGHVDGIETVLGTIDADTGNLPTIETNTNFGTVVGGGTETGALRVTIANNSTGVVSVDDNGGALTVDGTVTANLSATDNAVLDTIDAVLDTIKTDTGNITTAVQLIDNAISGSEMQVDVVGSLPAGTNAIGKLSANSGVDIGDVDVTSIAAGTNAIGDVGIIPRTSGGLTIFRSIDLDESEEEVKSSAGQLFSISAFNTTDAPLYLKFYNATAANVTVGTTTPVLTFVVPGNADSDGAGFVWNNDIGLTFGTAISAAVTTGVADNDTGAPGANACIVNLGYK